MQPEGDLWDHTMLVLDLLPPDPSFTLAFAALLHDAGKPATRVLHRGRYAFHHHEQAGAGSPSDSASGSSSPMPNASGSPGWSPITSTWERPGSSASRSSSESWPHPGIEELLALHEADALASFGQSEEVDYCRRYLELEPTGPINPPPLINGHDLVRHGLEPEPSVRDLARTASRRSARRDDPQQARGARMGRPPARRATRPVLPARIRARFLEERLTVV